MLFSHIALLYSILPPSYQIIFQMSTKIGKALILLHFSRFSFPLADFSWDCNFCRLGKPWEHFLT